MASQFRTLRISDPRFESYGLRFVTVKSKHLGRRGNVVLFIPKEINSHNNIPVHILLHGVYGSASSWAMQAGAHKTTQRLIQDGKIKPCILAMPSDGLWGDGSGYISHEYESYEKWIVEDVPALVKEVIGEKIKLGPYSIAGLSMGGYGALLLGAKYHNLFEAISAHSAITKWEGLQPFVEENIHMINNPNGHQDVVNQIIQHKDHLPSLRFDCGLEDDLLEPNRLLHRQLEEANIPHIYEEFSGGHEWPYWEAHLEETLLFFDKRNIT